MRNQMMADARAACHVTRDAYIAELAYLEQINLAGCSALVELPEELGNSESLEEIGAQFSGLASLPPTVGKLRSLKKLVVDGCKALTQLPEELGNCDALTD